MKRSFFIRTAIVLFSVIPFFSFSQNDLCAGATSLTLGNPCVNGTTVGMADNITSTAGCQAGGNGNAHNDVWYTFTSTGTQFTATLTASAPFTGNLEFILVSGACGAQTIVNSVCGASPLSVTINGLTAGTTYYAIVSNQGNGTPGPFTICNYTTTSSSCTANDDCFTAQTVTLNAVGSGSACVTGCNTGASPGLDFVGTGCEDMPNPTVWYTFTTGATAAQINVSVTSATMTDPEFTIFSNTTLCLGPYTILDCVEGTGGSATTNSLLVSPNTTYYIAVSDATGDQGNFNLCITQNPDNSACNTNDNLTVIATSMGSALTGPYQPGEVVTFEYTLTDWQQINCNYLGAVVPTFGNCWDPASFNAQGMPVTINTPLNVNGVIQPCPPGPPCAYNACAGTAAGSWNWFPAGAATYNVAGGSLPAGSPMGAGWYFLSSYNPATGACTGDPTDPDNSFGDGNFPACNTNTFDYLLRFSLIAGPSGNCGAGATDCGVSIKTYADGEYGAWNNIGCTVDIPVAMSPTLSCCTPPNMTSANTATICSGDVVSIPLTSDIASTYSWVATANANVTGESTTAQTTSTLSNTLINTTGSVQTVIYTVTPTSTASCLGVAQSVTITVNPTPTITVNSATICSGTSTVLTANGGTTYTWTPGTGLSSTNGSTVTANPSGTTSYTVSGSSAAGCVNSRTLTVTVNTTPTITVNSVTLCSGTSSVLTASGGTTYTWTPGTSLSATSGSTVSANPTTTTVYTVTGTTAGCSGSNTSTVTVNPTPTVTVNSATLCSGASTVLTANGGTTYSWTPGTGLSATTGSTVSANPTVTTVYTVTGTSTGCSGTRTSTVTINPIPTTTASTTGTLTCTNTVVILNSTLAGQSYTWVAPAGGTLGTSNAQNTSASGATGTYSLFVQSAAGCTYSTTTAVTQNTTAPTGVNAGPGGALTCAVGTSVNLTGSVTTPTNATASWTGPNICGSSTSFTTAACGAGIYTLTATNPSNGCVASSTVEVLPSAGSPAVTNNPVTNTLTCTNTLVTVSITTTVTPVSYTWSGPAIVGATTNSVINVSAGGTYNYTVTNTSNGCTTAGSQSVSQNTVVPTTTATTSGTLTCATNTVALNASLAGMSYTWTAPAGGSVSSANTQTTSASGSAGTYSLTVVDPANGCSFTTTTSVTQNTTTPVTVASTTGTLTCSNTTVTLNSTLTGMNYTWTAPAGGSLSSVNTQSTIASGVAGTYTLTIIDPSNGCSNTATTAVTQNTTAPTTTASVTGSVTCVTTTVTLNSTLAGVNYTWTAPSGSSISSGVNSQNAIGSGTGTYTLTIVDPSNGCSFETTALVGTDLSTPTGVDAGLSQTLTCLPGSSVTLSGSVTGPVGTTANWLGGVCGSATNFTTSACAAAVYTLEATHPNTGCTATATVEVFSPPGAPSASITAITNSITCTNTVVNVEMTTTELTYTVNWSGPGIISASNTNTIDVNQGGVYTVTVTNTAGCATIINGTVPTNTSVVTPVINGSATITCSAPSTTLDVTPSGTAYSYSWNGPGIVGSTTGSSITANAGGDYSVTVTETVNGCVGTASVTVVANGAIPTATISPVSSNSVITCSNTNVDLIVNSTPSSDMTYVWSNSANTQTTSVNAAGTYTAVVTNTVTGCFTSAIITITSNVSTPTVSVADATITCGASSATIGAIASNVSYTWTTSGTGSILSGSNSASPTVGSAGQYVVTVTDNTNGCVNSGTVNVTQNAISTAISANPMSGTAPLAVDFSNVSTGGSNYSWNFGDTNNNTSTSSAPTHTYNTMGTYVVTFTVTDASGLCSATASLSIEVFENSTIIIPNVFTPNGDNSNDVFKITTNGINTLTCDIFNRWGQKMFTIASPNESWDGKATGGAAAPDGTYFFMLKATGFDGKEYEEQGYLTLFR